jgi:hypothetical protein
MKKATSSKRGVAAKAPAANARRKQPAPAAVDPDEIQPEYDFRGGVRGKYAERFAAGPVRVVVLAPDVAGAFGSARAVNAALRRLLKQRDRSGSGRSRRTA